MNKKVSAILTTDTAYRKRYAVTDGDCSCLGTFRSKLDAQNYLKEGLFWEPRLGRWIGLAEAGFGIVDRSCEEVRY
jgi:hypothetical protein